MVDGIWSGSHDHGATDAIWIVKAYDPASYFVQFYKIEPEYKVGVVTVQCIELGPAKTKVQVTYKYQALSTTGEEFIAGFSEKAYEEFIGEWQQLNAASKAFFPNCIRTFGMCI
jgi:hypothetical protein